MGPDTYGLLFAKYMLLANETKKIAFWEETDDEKMNTRDQHD